MATGGSGGGGGGGVCAYCDNAASANCSLKNQSNHQTQHKEDESIIISACAAAATTSSALQLPNPNTKLIRKNVDMFSLLEQLTDETSKALEVKINKFLISETNANCCFLINLLAQSEEAVVQAIGEHELQAPIRLALHEQTIGALAESQIGPLSKSIFDEIVGRLDNGGASDGCRVTAIPIFQKRDFSHPVLLVCLQDLDHTRQNEVLQLVHSLFKYCLTLLINTRAREEETRQKHQCQSLLTVARKLFSNLGDINDLLREIMSEAKQLTNAERCSLFLIDPDDDNSLVAKVFDGASQVNNEVRIACDQGIAGHVATTGELLNIRDAYEHPLFYKGIDEVTGFKTRNILCFPICDEKGIVGVAQLCNKISGTCFNYFDEEVANAFSIYCGLSIMHSLVYKQIQDERARNKLSNELMMYHMKVSDEDIKQKMTCTYRHHHQDFIEFTFSPRLIIQNETVCFVLKMFDDLGFIAHFKIKKDILTRFVMLVEKGYRDTPYHNWMHAFSVCHFAYLCLMNYKLVERGYISHLDALAYFVSCLCHDIDHRGTNNSFQQQSNSLLASLYSSQGSVMERHHFSQTLCTLNTEGCNFLEALNQKEYSLCLDLIQKMILATDLATHFKLYKKQLSLVQNGYDGNNVENHNAFLCLLMTCADLSDQIKEWKVVKKVAELIYEEFFTQGDLEKKMGRKPIEMMDREKASIPDSQVEFLSNVCLPVFKILVELFPESKHILNNMKKNVTCWKASKAIFDQAANEEKDSLKILTSAKFEKDLLSLVKDIEDPIERE